MHVKLYEKESKSGLDKNKCDIYKIFRYCPNCNTDFSGTWLYEEDNTIEYRDCYTSLETLYPNSRYISNGYVFSNNELNEIRNRTSYNNYNSICSIKPSPWAVQFHQEIQEFLNMKKCPICGEPFVGKTWKISSRFSYVRWSKQSGGWIKDKSFDKVKEGEKYIYNGGFGRMPGIKVNYDVEFYDPENEESVLKFFQEMRNLDWIDIANDNVESFIKKCSSLQENANIDVQSIKSDPYLLTEFILNTKKIESDIFALTKRLKELYYERAISESEVRGTAIHLSHKSKKDIDKLKAEYEVLTCSSNTEKVSPYKLGVKMPTSPVRPQKEYYPLKPSEPVLKKAMFFNKKAVTAESEKLISKYKEELSKYEKRCKEIDKDYEQKCKNYDDLMIKYKKAMADFEKLCKEKYEQKKFKLKEKIDLAIEEYNNNLKTNSEILTPEKIKFELINEEILKAEELLSKLFITRSQIYDSGLIFKKYCNFVAICSIAEYLSSGRCTSLEGHEGAYNIYENEIRMDLIIDKLDNVIESLDEIKKNQYMIYSEINETNEQLAKLNNTMKNAFESIKEISSDISDVKKYAKAVSDNTRIIAHHSQVNAFYSAVTATLATHSMFENI